MRVTSETKEATRQAILDATRKLLVERGWERVGTREIASEAGVANGTLFNYFPTKEAIVAELMAEALAEANAGPRRGSAEEQVYALIAGGIRRLRPFRAFLPFVLGSILANSERLRNEHLAQIEQIVGRSLPPMLRHLYWSLYFGVLTFWVSDDSPKQVETLAFVDHSVALFCASLKEKERGI
jgi:AcrR family transcriptional regulator